MSNSNLLKSSSTSQNKDSDFETYLAKRKKLIDSQLEELFNLDKEKLKENILIYQSYFKQEELDNDMDAFLVDEEKFDNMAFYELWDILIMLVKREIRMTNIKSNGFSDYIKKITEKTSKYEPSFQDERSNYGAPISNLYEDEDYNILVIDNDETFNQAYNLIKGDLFQSWIETRQDHATYYNLVSNAIDIRLSFDILFESLNLGELIADGNFSFNNLVTELRSYILKEHFINERNNLQTHPGRRPLYMFNDEHFLQEIIILLAVQVYNQSYPDKKINFNTEIINARGLANPRELSLPMLSNFMTTFLPTVDGENVIDKIVKLLENDYDTDDKKFIKSL